MKSSSRNNSELKEAVFTPIAASPLSSSMPDFVAANLISLGRSYLQEREVAYLGHVMKAIRPFAGNICRSMGAGIYDEMIRTCPEVSKNTGILHLASTSNEIRFGESETFETAEEQEQATHGVKFMNEMVNQMDTSFDEQRGMLVDDYIRYGNGIAEMEYGKGYGRLKDRLIIKSIRSVNLDTVVIMTDGFNRTIGFAPFGIPGMVAPLDTFLPADTFIQFLFDNFETQAKREDSILASQMLPRHKCIHMQWRKRTNDPRGEAMLDAAFQPWWAKQQIMPVLLSLIEEWSHPRKKGSLGEKADKVRLYDERGNLKNNADNTPAYRDPIPALHNELHSWGANGSLALPSGYTAGIEQSDPAMFTAIQNAIDFFNREISTAITMQFLSSGQGGRSGGEKGVESHRDVLSLLILKIKSAQSRAIREQMVKPIIKANFGKAAGRYAPKADFGDADGFPVSLDELGFLAQSMPNFFTPDMFPEVGRRIGFPYIKNENRISLPKSAAKDANSLSILLQSQLQCQKGNFSIDFTE